MGIKAVQTSGVPDWTTLFAPLFDTQTWSNVVLAITVAYVLTQSIAFVYAKTYEGLSYSRNLVQSLVVAGPVAAMLMLSIGNSLARGIGIVGTLALIRFRTNIRDPLDMVFIFAAFGAGIAAGTGSFAAGIIGTAAFLVIATVMRWTHFGAQIRYDGVVRLLLPKDSDARVALDDVLSSHCDSFVLISLREAQQGEALEHAYQVTLKRPGDEDHLVSALSRIDGLGALHLSMQEATVEL